MNDKYKNNKKVIANLVLIFGLMHAFNAFSDVTITNELPNPLILNAGQCTFSLPGGSSPKVTVLPGEQTTLTFPSMTSCLLTMKYGSIFTTSLTVQLNESGEAIIEDMNNKRSSVTPLYSIGYMALSKSKSNPTQNSDSFITIKQASVDIKNNAPAEPTTEYGSNTDAPKYKSSIYVAPADSGSIEPCNFTLPAGKTWPLKQGDEYTLLINQLDTSGQCNAKVTYGAAASRSGANQDPAADDVTFDLVNNKTKLGQVNTNFKQWNQYAAGDVGKMIELKKETSANSADYVTTFATIDLPFPLTPPTDHSQDHNLNYLDNLVQAWWNNQSVVDWTNSDAVETAYEAGKINSLDIAKHMLIVAGMMDLYKNNKTKFTYYKNLFIKLSSFVSKVDHTLLIFQYHYIEPNTHYDKIKSNTLSDIYILGALSKATTVCNDNSRWCDSSNSAAWEGMEDWSVIDITGYDLTHNYKIITSGYSEDTAVDSSYSRAALPFLYLLNITCTNVDFSAILKSTLSIEQQLIDTTKFIGAQSTTENYRTDYYGDAHFTFDEPTQGVIKVYFSDNQSFNSSTDDGLNIPFSLGAYLLTSQGDTTQKDNQDYAKIILNNERNVIKTNAWDPNGNKNIYTHFTGKYDIRHGWSFTQQTDTPIDARETGSYLLAQLGLALQLGQGKPPSSVDNSQQITSLTDRIKDILKSYTNSVPDDASNIILTALYINGAFNPKPYQNALIDHPYFRLDPNN